MSDTAPADRSPVNGDPIDVDRVAAWVEQLTGTELDPWQRAALSARPLSIDELHARERAAYRADRRRADELASWLDVLDGRRPATRPGPSHFGRGHSVDLVIVDEPLAWAPDVRERLDAVAERDELTRPEPLAVIATRALNGDAAALAELNRQADTTQEA